MAAIQDAQRFALWAAQMNLIEPGIVQGLAGAAAPFDAPAAEILRKRQVELIGADDSEGKVFVFTKRRLTKKEKSELPAACGASQVEYRQSSTPSIGGNVALAHASPYSLRQNAAGQVYTCGSSISLGNSLETGTLGCLVVDAAGVIYGLSNNHVTGGCNNAAPGMPILAPGVTDVSAGGLDPFTLGHHSRVLPMSVGSPQFFPATNNFDAAIFKIKTAGWVTSFQGSSYDTPQATGNLTAGLDVEKVGRTTGHTTGRVLCQIVGSHPILYQAPAYAFSGFVHFDPLFVVEGTGGEFSSFGDSGALVVALDVATGNRQAVGIILGGGPDPTGTSSQKVVSIVAPITPVLANLGVSLLSGHNIL